MVIGIVCLLAGFFTGKFSAEAIYVPVVFCVVGFEVLLGAIIEWQEMKLGGLLGFGRSIEENECCLFPRRFTARNFCVGLMNVGLLVLGAAIGNGPPPNVGIMLFFCLFGVFVLVADKVHLLMRKFELHVAHFSEQAQRSSGEPMR